MAHEDSKCRPLLEFEYENERQTFSDVGFQSIHPSDDAPSLILARPENSANTTGDRLLPSLARNAIRCERPEV